MYRSDFLLLGISVRNIEQNVRICILGSGESDNRVNRDAMWNVFRLHVIGGTHCEQ